MAKSYCDECVHQLVCGYKRRFQDLEAKGPNDLGEITSVVNFTISCRYRNTKEDYQRQ